MANVKSYRIVINGVEESIDAIDKLNKQLGWLDERINKLSQKSINVSSSGGGSAKSNVSALSEEEKLAKQIAQTDAKREAYSKEIYQNYLASKELLSETVKDQKQLAAAERLQAKTYSNTMAGLKQELADIKSVMQTTDLGSDEFTKLTERANELNEKLKEIEATYGQFGRNVGNYQSGFESLNKLVIKVGDTEREFNNAREASKTLKNELINLEAAGKGSTQQADNLRKAIYNLKSIMDDATKSSKAMDEAMDFMQSFTAMANIGNGFKSFFGMDDNEITRSIQKLVALQGVLNGLETIRKQMQTQEGIGKLLAKNNEYIDDFVTNLTGAQKRMGLFIGETKKGSIAINLFAKALKGLSSIGWMAAITVAVDLLQKLGTAVSDWVKGDADLINSTDAVNAAIDYQNKVLEERLKLVQANMNADNITADQARLETEKAYAKALEETNKRLKEREDILGRNNISSPRKGTINLDSVMGDMGNTTVGGFDKAIESIDDFIKRWDELEKAVANERGFDTMLSSASDAKDELEHLSKLVGRDFVNAIHLFSDGTQEGAKALSRYIDKMDELTSGRYSKAIQLVKVDNEGLQKELDEAWNLVQTLRDKVFKNPIIVKLELDAKIEGELDKLDPTRVMERQLNEWKTLLKKGVNEAGEALSKEETANINKIVKEQEKLLKKARRDRAKSEHNDAKALANESETYRKQLNELRIQNMKEGLQKELAQLEEEKRQKLFQIRVNGVKVRELEIETNKLYDKKMEDATRKHAAEMAAIYKDMWNDIHRITDQSIRMNLDSELTQYQTTVEKLKEEYDKIFSSQYASYGGTRFNTNVSDSLKSELGYWTEDSFNKEGADFTRAKEYLNLLEDIKVAEYELAKAGENANGWFDALDEYEEKLVSAKKALSDWINLNKTEEETVQEFTDFMEDNYAVQELRLNQYTQSVTDSFKIRLKESNEYYSKLETLQKYHSELILKNELELLKNEENAEKRSEADRYESQMAELQENLRNGLLTQENYNELAERAAEEHAVALEAIAKRAATEQERLTQEDVNRKKQIVADGLRGILNEYRDAYNAISKIQTRQPQTDKEGWGVVNIKQTRKNYKEALEAYEELSNDILNEKRELQEKLDNNEITFDDFQQAKRELDGLAQDTADAAQEVTENLKDVEGEFIRSIQQYIQFLGQGLQTIMSAVWDAQDVEFDKEQEALDKQNDMIEKALDKNEEILEKHKQNVNDIEDELSTARGDRREHLIDQLNAEIEAERRAAAEKKALEKQQEAQEKKQEALNKKRQEAEYKRNLASIIVSGAMAAVNAYATKPFIPVGLTMGSLAIALTAAQYAIAKSAKPYAHGGQLDGGVADGPRHSQGGIKVLGGRAEIEGGEFVTNRVSTAKNIDLLQYINSSKKKVNINDLIDFYQGDVPRKTISNIKSKFADGGQLGLPANLDIREQLQNVVVAQDTRPVWVAVKDINDKQADVKRVQVLAGLKD